MSNEGNKIIECAQKYIGIPYVWGGESMSEGGFDCSGLVYKALKDAGYNVPRDTAQGYYNRFKKNIVNYTTAGALLVFGKSLSNITHIAINLGNGNMIESIGSRINTKYLKGKGVTVSKITRRKDLLAAVAPFTTNVSKYYPKYTGKSSKLDDMLKTVGASYGSVNKRKSLAAVNGIYPYSGTYSENMQLIKLVKSGTLRRC